MRLRTSIHLTSPSSARTMRIANDLTLLCEQGVGMPNLGSGKSSGCTSLRISSRDISVITSARPKMVAQPGVT
jgi:hypothetical protein